MKLFKKLAAAALAAVLALTMVGCGGSSSVLMKDELLKVAMDQMTMNGKTANHSKELDALAAKLVQEADKVAGQDAHKGRTGGAEGINAQVFHIVGAKYYQGTRSPNEAEREAKGYSSAWMHHKGRNKHHFVVFFQVEHHAPHTMRKLQKLTLHRLLKAVDTCDTICNLNNRAHFCNGHMGRISFDLFFYH